MKLTPLDIRGKEFKHTMRGYLGADVDDFLEQIAEEFERLFGANIALAEHCEEMEERLERYQQLEQTLRNTLTVAQRGAEELMATAQREAELITSEAELTARQKVNDAYPEKQAAAREIDILRGVEQDLRFRFRSLLAGYARQLDEDEVAARAPTPTPGLEGVDRHQANVSGR